MNPKKELSKVKNAIAEVVNEKATTALNVSMGEIAFPEGVETLGEKANYLHNCSIEMAKRSTGAAILAGWILSVAKSNCAHGTWGKWLEENVIFSQRTASNYMTVYDGTLGAARSNARRPIALSVEPTIEEIEAAAHDVDGSALSSLYKSTRIMARNPDHGGPRDGAGRKAAGDPLPNKSEKENAKAIWAELMRMATKKTVKTAIALLDEKTTEVCWGTVLELYEALKDHRAEFKS